MPEPSSKPSCPPTRVCLIRHGETEWNAQRRLQGQIDIDLNETGRHQAAMAARSLVDQGITVLYSSDLKRAWATAQAIGAALRLDPRPAPELRERCYGKFEGITYEEAQVQQPEAYAAFIQRDPDYNFDTGESLRQMFARVTAKLRELVHAHQGERIAVVLHGGVLDIVHRFVSRAPLEKPRDFPILNAAINWIVYADGQWSIESWGDVSHLQTDALDELPA